MAVHYGARYVIRDLPGGGSAVVFRSNKSVAWWLFLAELGSSLVEFIIKYGTAEQAGEIMYEIVSFHDEEVVKILDDVYEAVPDDVADTKHPDFATFTAIYKLTTVLT